MEYFMLTMTAVTVFAALTYAFVSLSFDRFVITKKKGRALRSAAQNVAWGNKEHAVATLRKAGFTSLEGKAVSRFDQYLAEARNKQSEILAMVAQDNGHYCDNVATCSH